MFTENYVPNPIDLAPRNTIESEGMDGQVMKWIKKLDLENCKWFYMSLSYNEISLINKFNIDMFISRARFRKGFQPHAFKKKITKSARKKIISSSLIMKDRPIKLRELIEVIIYFSLNYYHTNMVFFNIARLELIEIFLKKGVIWRPIYTIQITQSS